MIGKRLVNTRGGGINPEENFAPVTYTGTNSTQSINVGFKPDLIWFKNRSGAYLHQIYDSIRGVDKFLNTGSGGVGSRTGTEAEFNDGGYDLMSFDNNGFTIGASAFGSVNENGYQHVAWCFKGGGSAVTNNDYLFAAQISANPDAGFSIVKTQTGIATGASEVQYGEFKYAHGLNQTPELIITKITSTTGGWDTFYYPDGTGSTVYGLSLNGTGAAYPYTLGTHILDINSTFAHIWNYPNANTTPSQNIITYNFHSVSGYQKIGSYTGTGSAGNKQTTGFQPRFVMMKTTSTTGNWLMVDSVRGNSVYLLANSNGTEASASIVIFESDGFSFSSANGNDSGVDWIYLAIA